MIKKKIVKTFFIIFILLILLFGVYYKFFNKKDTLKVNVQEKEDVIYSSNIIENVKYTTKDNDGNEYIITALQGEIDFSNPNTLFLTKVNALIKLVNSNNIYITSKYGKYNSSNFDTIFSEDVKINYLDNKITGEYADFSLQRNSMLISRKVVYTNLENILRADNIEIDITTKDAKIFMYESEKKVNIKSKN
tara:strand:+ start:177 stop:752 length:576 start_codon:yes stop_codon:yes gene_type:complete